METPVRLESWDSESVTISGTGRPFIKKETPPSSGKYGFNIQFIKGLISLLPHGQKKDLLLPLILLGTIILNLYVGSISGTVTGQFYKLIVDKNLADFKTVLWKATLIVIFSSVLESQIKVLLDLIGYRWRKALVKHIHSQYFTNAMYYQILHLDHTIDNPDQRIAQDLDAMTKAVGTVLRALIEAPLQIGYYGYLTIEKVTWYSPLLVVGYWLVAYLVNKLLMNPSASAVFRQEQLEGNFRFGHLRMRTFAESVALYGGSNREREIAETSFSVLMKNRLRLIKWESCVTLSSNVFAYFAGVLNYAIVSLPIFQGWTLPESAGSAAQYVSVASFQLIMFINGFTTINNASRDMSDFIGYTNRISQMLEVMKKLKNSEITQHLNRPDIDHGRRTIGDDGYDSGSMVRSSTHNIFDVEQDALPPHLSIQVPSSDDSYPSSLISQTSVPSFESGATPQKSPQEIESVEFRNFSAYTPSGQPLIKNLSLRIPTGQCLLITGPSGSGKTSILRCLSGLWRSFEGEIDRPSSILFLPQRPYMPFGSLQDQLRYPLSTPDALLDPNGNGSWREPDHIDPTLLLSILKDVELDHLIRRPHAYGSMTAEAREAMRDLIEDRDGDSLLDESSKLLVHETTDTRRKLLDIIDQMESSNLNWTEVLSPGEQQRIGLARVLYHRPRFAILDEATSSIDEPMEEKFYGLCKKYNITAITVGHKSSLRQHHDRTLKLDRRGGWQVE